MASLYKNKAGERFIQFVDGSRKRRSIRLGKVPQKAAETIKAKVESLSASIVSQTSWDRETASWVAKLEPTLHDKLACVGLLPKRSSSQQSTLGAFLDAYLKGRTDVKGSTAIAYGHTRRCLIGFFGANKPLKDVTPADGDDWRRWLTAEQNLAENTIRRRCGLARQFFRAAVRRRLISENPFADMKGVTVRANRTRDHFITTEVAARVLEACPDNEWRLIFAFSRFGGLRCPSEHLGLRWGDVDWANNRLTIHSPKTEHHEGKGMRIIPLFPELRPHLEDAWELAAESAKQSDAFIITRYRDAKSNLRTQMERILQRAGVKPWEKLFANLRASRATELAAAFPSHVAAEWLGHSQLVAQKHYWQVTEEDFTRAVAAPADEALHMRLQSAPVLTGTESHAVTIAEDSSEKSRESRQLRVKTVGAPRLEYVSASPLADNDLGISPQARAAYPSAFESDSPSPPSDLAFLIERWSTLTPALRAQIVALVESEA